jgi:transposase
MDLRQRVIDACDAGGNTKQVAKTYRVSPAWVRRLKQHRRERGDIAPRNGGGSRGRKIDRDRLAELVRQQPDATLVELRDRLGVTCTPWAISKALRELKLTYKKVDPCGRAGPARRRRGAGGVAREPVGPGPGQARVH